MSDDKCCGWCLATNEKNKELGRVPCKEKMDSVEAELREELEKCHESEMQLMSRGDSYEEPEPKRRRIINRDNYDTEQEYYDACYNEWRSG